MTSPTEKNAAARIRRSIARLQPAEVGSTWDATVATRREHDLTANPLLDPEWQDQSRGYVPDDDEE